MRAGTEEDVIGRVASVQIGRVAPIGFGHVLSGIVKHPTDRPLKVGTLGIEGDEQADLRIHGGPDRAVYGYALSAYRAWRDSFPQHAPLLVPGGMGENLTIDGMDERTVCLGDAVAIGTVVLQVTQPCEPCFKLALHFGDKHMPRAMTRNGRSGWYYRVLQPGTLVAGDDVRLVRRTAPDWTIERFNVLLVSRSGTRAEMRELLALDGLAEHWRETARQSLEDAPEVPAV